MKCTEHLETAGCFSRYVMLVFFPLLPFHAWWIKKWPACIWKNFQHETLSCLLHILWHILGWSLMGFQQELLMLPPLNCVKIIKYSRTDCFPLLWLNNFWRILSRVRHSLAPVWFVAFSVLRWARNPVVSDCSGWPLQNAARSSVRFSGTERVRVSPRLLALCSPELLFQPVPMRWDRPPNYLDAATFSPS